MIQGKLEGFLYKWNWFDIIHQTIQFPKIENAIENIIKKYGFGNVTLVVNKSTAEWKVFRIKKPKIKAGEYYSNFTFDEEHIKKFGYPDCVDWEEYVYSSARRELIRIIYTMTPHDELSCAEIVTFPSSGKTRDEYGKYPKVSKPEIIHIIQQKR